VKTLKSLFLTACCVLSFSPGLVAANLVFNSGFEDPVTFDGPPFVGSWEGFNGGGASAGNSLLFPRNGLQSLGISINNTANTFAGAFQDIPGLFAGSEYNFGGWHATTSNPLQVGVEVRIEWRNSVSNTEITRTPNFTPVPGAAYSPFNFNAIVPAGADTARIVYAIQSFSTSPLGNGTVYVDDVSFALVPEPSALALLTLGGLAFALRRRHA
jgi:hypothetical protein